MLWKKFSPGRCSGTDTDCPEGLWSLYAWRYSEFDRTWPWATCPNKAGLQSWHYFEQGLNHMAFRGPVHPKLFCDPAHFCVNVSLILVALSFNFVTFDRFSARVLSHISGILTPQGNIWVYERAQEGRRLCFIATSCPSLGWCQTQTSPVCRPHPAAVPSKATPGALIPHHPLRAQEKLSLQHLHVPDIQLPPTRGESHQVWAALLQQAIMPKQLLSRSLKIALLRQEMFPLDTCQCPHLLRAEGELK